MTYHYYINITKIISRYIFILVWCVIIASANIGGEKYPPKVFALLNGIISLEIVINEGRDLKTGM